MMRAAGIMGKEFPLKAICAVNNPFDLWLSINLMRGNDYEKFLAKELKRKMILKEAYESTEAERG